jgi:hypothetical protein
VEILDGGLDGRGGESIGAGDAALDRSGDVAGGAFVDARLGRARAVVALDTLLGDRRRGG